MQPNYPTLRTIAHTDWGADKKNKKPWPNYTDVYDQNLITAAFYMEQPENPILENLELSITLDSILP